jgi:DNA-binding CsgD family transcriptional regulator
MSIDEASSELIASIYAGAHDHGRWNLAIDTLVERTASRFAFVAILDANRFEFPSSASYGCDDGRLLDGVADYTAEHYRHDPTAAFVGSQPQAGVVRSTDVIPANGYLEDPYIRWSVGSLGSAFWQIHYTPPWQGLTLGLSLHRTADRGPFDAADSRLIALMFGHMVNAQQLASHPTGFAENHDAALLIDREGHVREASDAARVLLAGADGLSLAGGRLRASLPGEQARLDAAIVAALNIAAGRPGAAVLVSRPSARRALILRISPFVDPPAPFDRFRPAALVRIIDPEARPSATAEHRWRTLYGLTRAEARLVVALLGSEGSLRDASEALGIAHSTARTQLAAVFDKTGTHSQAQLMRLATLLGG